MVLDKLIIIMIYTKQNNNNKSSSLKPKHRQNIGSDKILVPQNIGGNKMLAPTKYLHWQNVGSDKILESTKVWCQQISRVNKILASTKYSRRQNVGTCMEASHYCFGPAESTAADFSQTLLMFSYFSQKVLIPPRAVTKCVLPLAALLLWVDSLLHCNSLLYRTAM